MSYLRLALIAAVLAAVFWFGMTFGANQQSVADQEMINDVKEEKTELENKLRKSENDKAKIAGAGSAALSDALSDVSDKKASSAEARQVLVEKVVVKFKDRVVSPTCPPSLSTEGASAINKLLERSYETNIFSFLVVPGWVFDNRILLTTPSRSEVRFGSAEGVAVRSEASASGS